MCIYIYILYTSILTSSGFVLGCERKQDRFKQTREKATRESKESSKKAERSSERIMKSNERARKNNEKIKREHKKSVLAFDYNCSIVCYVCFNQDCCLNLIV